MERFVATQFYKADSPESRILRESGIAPSEFVLATDAQATIATLQSRVKELEEITKVICGHCCEPMEIPSKAVLQSQLTQRTAELEAANIRADKAVQDRADVLNVKSTDGLTSSEWIMRTATAERKVKDLQAELERVRGELVEATHNVNVYQSLYSTGCMDRALLENDLRELRTLIAALPKVEGAVEVSAGDDGWYILPLWIRCVTKEQADGIAALLQHRQGMEG